RPAHERTGRRLRLRRGHSPEQYGAVAMIENSSPVRAQAERGKAASRAVALLSAEAKNAALGAMAAAFRAETASILRANADEVARARAAGTASHLIDRLSLDAKRLQDMAKGIEAVAALPDPIGEVLERDTRPNGLQMERVRVPIGLIAVIY